MDPETRTTNTREYTQDSFDGLSVIEDDVLPAVR
jgi:hypothetical protein